MIIKDIILQAVIIIKITTARRKNRRSKKTLKNKKLSTSKIECIGTYIYIYFIEYNIIINPFDVYRGQSVWSDSFKQPV